MVEKVQEDGFYLLVDDLNDYMEISSDKEADELHKKTNKMYD